MSLKHAYSQTVADGTATSVVRPSDWNSAHVLSQALGGNTSGASSFSGLDVTFYGGPGITLGVSQGAGAASTAASLSFNGHTFANANGVSFGTSANGAVTASVQGQSVQTQNLIAGVQAGTTSQNAGPVSFANGNGVSFGMNGSTVTASVAAQSVQTQSVIAGVGGGGATVTSGQLALSNSNGVSFGVSSNGMVTASVKTDYAGTGTTFGGTNVSATLNMGANGLAMSLSAAAGGGGGVGSRSYAEINQGERFTTIRNLSETVLSNRPIFMPFWVEGTGIVPRTIRFFMSGGASTNNSLGISLHVGLYSLVNSTQMTLLTSGSMSYSYTATSQSSVWNGPSVVDFTGMTNFTQTQEGRYMLALMARPVSANSTWANMMIYGCDNYPNISRFMSGNTTGATNATNQLLPWQGVLSTTTAALPDSVHRTAINGGNSASAMQPYAVVMGY